MKTNGYRKRNREAGFSMVEVLVASTILIVIVMLLSMIFQQTSLAWRAGVKRADGYLGIRAVLSAIQRDASAMIDISNIPVNLRNGSQEFGSSSLKFYTLNTRVFADDNSAMRALRYITYNASGHREEYALEANSGWQLIESSDVRNIAERSGNPNAVVPQIDQFEFVYGTGLSSGQPLYLTITAQVTPIGSSFDIGAESSGPDRVFGDPSNPDDPKGKDDIKTWVK